VDFDRRCKTALRGGRLSDAGQGQSRKEERDQSHGLKPVCPVLLITTAAPPLAHATASSRPPVRPGAEARQLDLQPEIGNRVHTSRGREPTREGKIDRGAFVAVLQSD